ncbi:MAG: repair protein RecO [Tepidanaerobacteraceae bacterium]|nr:repair protein RecO [Tepidanaerobacteraceae bacterium]
MSLYRTDAVVLGHRNIGEADRILTLFSPEKGKIHAVARGVRRLNNRLLGGTQLFTFSNFLIVESKTLDSISQCEVKESFHKIRSNLERMAYGLYFAEMLRASTPEEDKNYSLFNFFLKTLYFLQEWNDLEVLSRIYEVKLMAIQGFTPEVFRCVNCGNKLSEKIRFSSNLGGVICFRCLKHDVRAVDIDYETVKVMRDFIKKPYRELIHMDLREEIKRQLKNTSQPFMLHHLDKKLKTMGFINDINGLKASAGPTGGD